MLKKMFSLSLGAIIITREKAEKVFDEMVERGECSREEAKKTVDKFIKRGEEEKNEFRRLIRDQLDKWRKNFGVTSRTDLSELEARVAELEKKLQ